MTEFITKVSVTIQATPQQVYAVFKDYRVGHPAILPKDYFTRLAVVEGGYGAGTVVDVDMKVMGVKNSYRFQVSEPEPDHILMEADEAAGVVTTFTIDPVDGGGSSLVTLLTRARASSGLRGIIEKWTIPPITRRIYRKELQILADYLRQEANRSNLA